MHNEIMCFYFENRLRLTHVVPVHNTLTTNRLPRYDSVLAPVETTFVFP